MSLAAWGFVTIFGLLAVTLSRKVSPLIALFGVPLLTALGAGFRLRTVIFALDGVRSIASVIGMFVFAILFFGVITDAGTVEPLIRLLLRKIGTRPSLVVPGTTLLAFLVHLDGSGAVVFIVTIPAVLAVYDRLQIPRKVLACAVSMAAGVNFLPWTGPTLRAATALHTTPIALFRPLIPVQAVGLVFIFIVAYFLGRREERRQRTVASLDEPLTSERSDRTLLPKFFYLNVVLVAFVLGVSISGYVDPMVVFMGGTMLAFLINFPAIKDQQERIAAHAPAALLMCSILFSAGVFSGIVKGTGMLSAMAGSIGNHLPQSSLAHLPFVLGLVAMPLSLVFDPDSFYLGLLPILAGVAAHAGVPPEKVAQAALLGQMTTGFPISPLTPATFLVVGLAGVPMGEHQRFSGPFLFAASVVMTIAAVLFGIFRI